MPRQQVLRFIEEFHLKQGEPPSIRTIAKNIDGVSKTNFYDLFPKGINEALNLLGIEGTVDGPTEALEARKAKTDTGYRITLSETQSKRILALAFMENRDVSMVIDDVLDRERQVREVLDQVDGGGLDSELIEAILNPELVYKGWNVSEFAGKPWIMLKCKRCGDPLFYGEGVDSTKWLFEIMPMIRRMFSVTCSDCVPKPPGYLRIPA